MDLRTLPDGLDAEHRISERRSRVETELNADLSILTPNPRVIGNADEKNCEQMIGVVPVPIGIAGPLSFHVSSGEQIEVLLPLATTEGALVASVNRGCKVITVSGGCRTQSFRHGTSRSMAFKMTSDNGQRTTIDNQSPEWIKIGESTSNHLKILKHTVDEQDGHVFLTIFCDTDEAMGMNMVTIAAQAIGEWIEKNIPDTHFVTVAANVDSDKKPSIRTYEYGRGFEATAQIKLSESVITDVLKTSKEDLLSVAHAKLNIGSDIADLVGENLHAANMISALYIATGQDAAHVVEGSMADTLITEEPDGVVMTVRLPALMIGIRGGGTELPAQKNCLEILLKQKTKLHPVQQLAETMAAAVLAGEISLLAALASKSLAKAHQQLGR